MYHKWFKIRESYHDSSVSVWSYLNPTGLTQFQRSRDTRIMGWKSCLTNRKETSLWIFAKKEQKDNSYSRRKWQKKIYILTLSYFLAVLRSWTFGELSFISVSRVFCTADCCALLSAYSMISRFVYFYFIGVISWAWLSSCWADMYPIWPSQLACACTSAPRPLHSYYAEVR